jgi:hypothetical protein
VAKVLLADDAVYENMLAKPLAALIVSPAPRYDALAAAATTTGKHAMPRPAARFDVMQILDITTVIAPDTFERLIHAGNGVQTVRAKDATRVITARAPAFQRLSTGNGMGRDDGFEGHPRREQGRGSVDFPGRGLRAGRRSRRGAAATRGRAGRDRSVSAKQTAVRSTA